MTRVLLTEDATPSARQVLTVLGWRGHHVEALTTGGIGLTGFSRMVARRHRVPPMGLDPDGYLDGLRDVLRRGSSDGAPFDAVLPTHEQVAVLSRHRAEFGDLAAVPDFAALSRVVDKVAATRLLTELDVPQPPTAVVTEPDELDDPPWLPCYLKLPIGTASRGVWAVRDRDELAEAAADPAVRAAVVDGPGVLVQQPVDGDLLMVQTVFDRGTLRAGHAARRVRVGVGNAASVKESVAAPDVLGHLRRLGSALGWHGALSADVIVDRAGAPHVIDLNPRVVEPVNGLLAGVDLVGALLRPEDGGETIGRPGVRTSMALMAVLRHGETGAGRTAVLRELLPRRGADAREELLGVPGDRGSAVLTAFVGAALLLRPAFWRPLTTSSAANALTVESWERIRSG